MRDYETLQEDLHQPARKKEELEDVANPSGAAGQRTVQDFVRRLPEAAVHAQRLRIALIAGTLGLALACG